MDRPEKVIAAVIAELYSTADVELRHKAARRIVEALADEGYEIIPREVDDPIGPAAAVVRQATEGR